MSRRLASVRAVLIGDMNAVPPMLGLHWLLRLACGLCFIGHGVSGVSTQSAWLPFYESFRIPEWIAWPAMPVVGTLDVTLGLTLLFHPCRAVLLWMAGWSAFTALLRPFGGLGVWEIFGLAGDYGPPIAFLLLSAPQRLGWFEKIEPRPIAPDALQRVRWCLQAAVVAMLIGRGALGAFGARASLPWSALPTETTRWLGAAETLCGIAALFLVQRAFLVAIAYAKLASALLSLSGGDLFAIGEVLQRTGEFAMPLALLCALQILHNPAFAETDLPPDTSPRLGLAHALRVGFASLVFTASLSTAYAWMRFDVRARERSFDDYTEVVAANYQHSGWLAPNLPPSARAIHEVHDIGTRAGLSSFYVSDPAEFLGYIGNLQENALAPACEPPAILIQPEPHWSAGLTRFRDQLRLVGSGKGRAYAYEPDTGQIFSWTCANVE